MPRQRKYEPRDRDQIAPPPRGWLHLEGIEVEGIIEETCDTIVVQAITCTKGSPECAKCESNAAVTKWDIRPRNIRDVEQDGKLVCLVLKIQRFFCANCKRTFTPPLQFLDSRRQRRTTRLTEKARHLGDERRTTSDVAAATGLSRRIVQSIVADAGNARLTPQELFRQITDVNVGGSVLQIDDAHPSHGNNTAILLNGRPLELLPRYDKDTIETFFLSLVNRESVKIYVSDLAPFLMGLGRTCFPGAHIVADPYHVIGHMLHCFDLLLEPFECRMTAEYARAIANNLLVGQIRFTGARRTRSGKEPSFREIKVLLHTKLRELEDSQKLVVKFLLRRFPEVRAGYAYVQRVLALYHTAMPAAEASITLDRYEARLPAQIRMCFMQFLDLCRRNRDQICAFWSCGWTNAEAEAQNGVIKDIDRRGRGLGFTELRRRWLYGHSTSAILGRSKRADHADTSQGSGPKKKIRELRSLPAPQPVPVVGLGGQGWLFDPPSAGHGPLTD